MWSFLKSLLDRVLTDNISFLAGGVAFYGLLALFPALAGIVSLFGLLANATVVMEQLEAVRLIFPPQAFKIIQEQLLILLAQPQATLSTTAIFSLLLTVYSATKGTKAMLAAINGVFRVQETRSWLYQQVESFLLTLGALVLMILAVFIVVATPFLLKLLYMTKLIDPGHSIEALRWLILSGVVFVGLFILFTIGPNRANKKEYRADCFRSVFWGAFIATALWVAIAVGGSVFMQLSSSAVFSAYGSLSAIIALMMWIYISAYIVLVGGAITAVAEQRHITCD